MSMEEKNCCGSSMCVAGKCEPMGDGKCGSMHGSMCHGHLLKKVVTMVVMIFIFWLGLQLGELRSLKKMQESREYGNYGYRMMGAVNNGGFYNLESAPGTITFPAVTGGTVAPATTEKTK